MTASPSEPRRSGGRRLVAHVSESRWIYILCSGLGASSGWAICYPRPYGLAVGLQALLPVLALLPMIKFRRLGGFDGKANDPSSRVAGAFLMPILALALRALLDWHILDWDRFWIPFAAIGAALLVLVVCFASDVRGRIMRVIIVSCLCLAYSYGLLVHIDCYYDASWGTAYDSRVRRHHAATGGRGPAMYYLRVSPWLNQPGEHQVTVSRSVYSRHADGDPVRIVVRLSLIHI